MSIRAEKLNYIYNEGTVYESHAIKDVSFEIKKGEFIGVIGHTASGKSTLVQLLNGLLPLQSGTLEVAGHKFDKDHGSLTELRKRVGLVFQYPEYQLFEDTVELDVAFGPKNMGYDDEKVEELVTRALTTVALNTEEIRKSSPFELSGGQKRRIAIAGVLAMDPEILIMDEPSSGLDPRGKAKMLNLMKAEHERLGRTTLIISHDMRDIARIADRILVMNKGEVYMFGTPSEVFREREALMEIGLDLPKISGLSFELNKRGFDIDTGIYDIEKWADIVSEQIHRKMEAHDA